MKMPGKMHRVEVLARIFGKMEKATSGRPRFGKKSGQAGRILTFGAGNARAMRDRN